MISADDYGMSSDINKGIETLSMIDRLDGFSVMVYGDYSKKTISYIKSMHDTKVGLHIDLNYFVDLGIKNIILLGLYSKVNKDIKLKMKAEVIKQFDLFKKNFGFWPDYVDGHQHCQMFKPVIEEIIKYKNDNVLEFWIRDSSIIDANIKALVINLLSYKKWKIETENNKIKTKKIFGIYNFNNRYEFPKKLSAYNNGNKSNLNFMTHPSIGIKDGTFRLKEFKILRNG
jgi:chitin disaccharide deacetylase